MERDKGQQVKMLWCLLFISLIGNVQCNSRNKCGNKIDLNVIYPKVTEPSSNVSSWWKLDLLFVHKIYCISIKPQQNADLMMDGTEVHVRNRWNHNRNKNCTKIGTLTSGKWSNFSCTERVSGRYIIVQNPGRINLHRYEIKIYGQERDLNTTGIPTSQSSGRGDHISKNAVDGDKTTCAMTQQTETEKNSWWRIDLPVPYNISYIIIYDTDNIIDIKNTHIHIRNSLRNNGTDNKRCKMIRNLKNEHWVYYKCWRTGRYVTVVSPERRLTLCEVKLIGKIKDLIKTTNSITSQSTNYSNNNVPYSSGRAIDGKIELCAHTLENKDSAFWKIDLLGVYTISFFCIYNQVHHNTNITGARIHIGNSRENDGTNNKMCAKITSLKQGRWNYYKCVEVSGRYITVFLPGPKPLVLCEVKIIGKKKVSPFKLINQNKTWEEALDYCRDRNWDLASILDEEDQALAEVEAMEANSPFVWLGLHHSCVLDAWFWVANHRLDFSRWGPGGLQRECDLSATMERVEDHQWYSKNDSDRFNFICQK